MRATQAASMTFIWPDGHVELIDFDAELNERIKEIDETVDRIKEILIVDSERRIISILQRYKPASRQRREIARDLISEYVIVGKERNGFLGVRAFTLEVLNPSEITFDVQELPNSIRNGQIIDYSEGDIAIHEPESSKAMVETIASILQNRNRSAEVSGNNAFSPPYQIMKLTHTGLHFLSDAGPCHI